MGLVNNDVYDSDLRATLHSAYIALNNKTLRQALSYAIDYESVIEVAYESLAFRAYALMGENSFDADFSGCVRPSSSPV